jgi:hypothetical protein
MKHRLDVLVRSRLNRSLRQLFHLVQAGHVIQGFFPGGRQLRTQTFILAPLVA